MREIFFRGKNKFGTWHYGYYTEGYYLDGTAVSWIEVVDRKEKDTESVTVIPETVGQFTGLTDKNGKKVFENDIIVICYETDGEEFSEIKRVHYNEKECCWYPMRWQECCEYCDHYTEVKSIEVIGNIHDNPELLGGER